MRRLLLLTLIISIVLLGACASPSAPPESPPAPSEPPASTPAPSPPPEPAPPPKEEGVGVQNCELIMYGPDGNTPYEPPNIQGILTGELINNTADNVMLIELLVSLKDLDRDVPLEGHVDAKHVEVLVPILRPGEVSPFEAYGATGYQVTNFKVEVDGYRRTTEELFWDVEPSECQVTVDEGWYTVKGKITNTGDTEAHFVQVVGTFYDDSGYVVSVDKNSLDFATHLLPGAEGTFTLRAICSPTQVSDFKVQAVAKQ